MEQEIQTFIAVPEGSDFSIYNIPFGASSIGPTGQQFPSTRIGDTVVNLTALESLLAKHSPLLASLGHQVFDTINLNKFIQLSRPYWSEVRKAIQALFTSGSELEQNQELLSQVTVSVEKTHNYMPVTIGEYTDFYSSRDHAYNIGVMLRGVDNALQPNWLCLPVGYHGRRSSVVISGTDVRRPWGQVKPPTAEKPSFAATRTLDIELEVGAFLGGPANALGEPLKVDSAEDRVFGLVLLNDWSARDVQGWEYVPLGPFGAKNFCTSISPWIVTLDALEPYRVTLSQQDPPPFPYLNEKRHSSFDINLEVFMSTTKQTQSEKIIGSNFKYLYWSIAQQLTHHSVTGCNMGPGDLLGSGTISGPTKESRGSLMELSWLGKEPFTLQSGEQRTFLQDGDLVTLRGFTGDGAKRIGFGECSGRVLSALDSKYFEN